MSVQQTYVKLGDDGDELGSNLVIDSAVRSKPLYKTNSPFANPHSTSNVFEFGALVHDEIIANWKIYCSYKVLLCVILLLFSLGSVSSGEAFRQWEKLNDSKLCEDSPIRSETQETNLFGDFSVAALLLTLIVCIWCFFSYITVRIMYKNPNVNITIKNIQHEKKLKRFDIIGITIDFIVLTIGISILGTDISKDIHNVNSDCPDNSKYTYNGTNATSISYAFNILHLCYWIFILLAIIYITTTKCCLKGSNKDKWIKTFNSKCCC